MPPSKIWHTMTEEEFQALTGQPSNTLVISKLPKPATSPSSSVAPRDTSSISGDPASSGDALHVAPKGAHARK